MKNNIVVLLALFFSSLCYAQNKPEREHRILKKQFPETEFAVRLNNKEFKKVKYYKEVSTDNVTYSIKLKKERLYYQLFFTEDGKLTTAALKVKEVDIANDTFTKIKAHLNSTFQKYKILEMQQQYHVTKTTDSPKTLKNTFQNLMLPQNIFRFYVKGKTDNNKKELFFFFNADGNHLNTIEALPKNHDRILY